MDFFLVLEKIGVIFLMILVGYFFAKLVKPTEQARGTLASLVLNISVPASILSSVNDVDFAAMKGDIGALMLIALGISLVTLALCLPLSRLMEPKDRGRRAVVQAALFFPNFGFLGWPVCYMLLGSTGLLYAMLLSMPLNVAMYGLTPVLLSRGSGVRTAFDKKLLINLPVYAAVAALALMAGGVKFPEFAVTMLDMLGATQTPLAMIIVGMILATVRLSDVISGWKPYAVSVIRLGLFPLLLLAALKWCGFSGLLLSVPVLLTVMPSATMDVVLTQRAGLDDVYASRLVVISTLLSLLAIPLVSLLVL
jgi:predicted permease